MKNPVIVALDVPTTDQAGQLAQRIRGHVEVVKVGYPLFIQGGVTFVEGLMRNGFRVFLDLKFHDIPNTVANALTAVLKQVRPYMVTLHTSGGSVMMSAAANARNEILASRRGDTLLLGVTVLTSIDHLMLGRELRVMGSVEAHVSELAWMASQSGLDGVVASSHELPIIRQRCGKQFLVVVPGIRPANGGGKDDQKRTMTPRDAVRRGADYLVIGRPILEAPDPVEAIEAILKDLEAVRGST